MFAHDSRPVSFAIISNSHTPYRFALHLRIARELAGVTLWSLYTHETSNAPWAFDPTEIEAIRPVSFGKGESSIQQDRISGTLREWRRGGRVIKWLKANDIRFVVMMGYNDAGRIRIIRWCRRAGVPCYLFGDSNIRGDRAVGMRAKIKMAIVSRIVRQCAGILCCGRFGREYFLKYGAKADRIFYFPYEPDYREIQSLTESEILSTAKKFGLLPGRRRLVFSGRLIAVKRADLLIDAFIKLALIRPAWDLLIIGDGILKNELANRVPENLSARVIWAGFLDDQKTVSTLYRNCDMLVLPSDLEPWGLVINEAAAAGLAIVASDVVGAAAELVRDGENGAIFPAGDGAALLSALMTVTDETNIDRMKARSPAILLDWRERADPVSGLREALRASGIECGVRSDV